SRALMAGAERLAENWDKRLMEVAYRLMENPGHRIAAAESAVGRFVAFCNEATEAHPARGREQAIRTEKAWEEVEIGLPGGLNESEGSSWSLSSFLRLGSRSRRSLQVFVDLLAAFSRQCLAGETLRAGETFFSVLHNRLDDRLRELGFCRQRLLHIQQSLA